MADYTTNLGLRVYGDDIDEEAFREVLMAIVGKQDSNMTIIDKKIKEIIDLLNTVQEQIQK